MDNGLMTIPEFCERNTIKKSFYHKLQAAGKGPRVLRVGGRRMISREAEAEWRKSFEGQYASPADLERLLRESVAILVAQHKIIRWIAAKNAGGTGTP
jgi:hypothetical protein